MNATEPVTRLRRELDALDRAYSEGHHGLWSAARRSDLFDAALRELFEAPGAPAGVALAAIGGYGRRQQLPRSDVDLLVLHEGDRLDEVAALVERLLYPLWDAGFEVGHAVRTAEECVVAARERLDGLTSMLDLRHLAGDRELADRAGASVRAMAADDPAGFAEVLRADARTRNERVGPAASMLQPDLKSGAGGLRDLQSLRWFEAVTGVPLEGAGLLRPQERTALEDAEEFLTRVRSALHLETDKRADVLPLELQPPIARAMGFADEPRLLAEDGLMRAVFEHARAVRWITGNVWDRMSAGAAPRPAPPIDGPAGMLEALADAAETDAPPSPALLDAIENVDLADRGRVDRRRPAGLPAAAPKWRGRGVGVRGARPSRPAGAVPSRVGGRAMPSATRPLPPVHRRRAPHHGMVVDASDAERRRRRRSGRTGDGQAG